MVVDTPKRGGGLCAWVFVVEPNREGLDWPLWAPLDARSGMLAKREDESEMGNAYKSGPEELDCWPKSAILRFQLAW